MYSSTSTISDSHWKGFTRLETLDSNPKYRSSPIGRFHAGAVFDLSLFGTWTWIPDEIFQRFDWPQKTKARPNEKDDVAKFLMIICVVQGTQNCTKGWFTVFGGIPEKDAGCIMEIYIQWHCLVFNTRNIPRNQDWFGTHRTYHQITSCNFPISIAELPNQDLFEEAEGKSRNKVPWRQKAD